VRAIVPAAGGGSLFVGGAFANAGGATRAFLAEIDTTTGLATAWDPGANDLVATLALVGDTLYVGGRSRRGMIMPARCMSTTALQPWDPNATTPCSRSRSRAHALLRRRF
jgi:hypothetical protein